MKRNVLLFAGLIMLVVSAFFNSCQKEQAVEHGTLHLSITDAPVDADGIAGVYVTFTGIQYHHNGSWKTFESFQGPQTFNLLDLTHGISAMLGSFDMEPGVYNQIRFVVDAPEITSGPIGNPGCYLEFEDGSTAPLFIPSGARTGLKAIGRFVVPVNGEVHLTADFDVRKSIVQARYGKRFILKPFIRLVAEHQAGMIKGKVLNAVPESTTVIYAYSAGSYVPEEALDPEPESPRFPNAISSDRVCMQGGFTLAFLAEGKYDLVVASFSGGTFDKVLGIVNDAEVTSKKVTFIEVDVSQFE